MGYFKIYFYLYPGLSSNVGCYNKMINRFVLFLGIIVSLSSCGGGAAYRIEGKLANLEDQTVYAVFENEDTKVVDTVMCGKPGQFDIQLKEGDFKEVTLFLENKTCWLTLFLEKGEKVSITGDANYPTLLQVKGGRINNQLTAMKKEIAPLLKEQFDLIRQLNKENKEEQTNTIEETDVTSRLMNVNHLLSEHASTAIKEHPDEEASVVLIQKYFANPDDTRRMDELLAVLSPKLNDFYMVKRLKEYSARAKRTALGAEAPDFNVKNIYGNTVGLDSFPNRYLLLAFTAPWCEMCQTTDLFLDEVVTKYPKEKLDVLLISLDENPGEVRKLLAKDSISWNLVTDSAGQAATLIDLYNISALPRCFLIDSDGKIILKTDNGIEIKQTLENLIE